jgi:hypothetical protein
MSAQPLPMPRRVCGWNEMYWRLIYHCLLLLLVIAAVVAYYCCRCGLFYYNVIRDKSRESEFSLEMPNVVNILNGLIEQHVKKRERERNMICDRQYQNIVHCENVDEIVTFGKGRPVVGRQQSYEM